MLDFIAVVHKHPLTPSLTIYCTCHCLAIISFAADHVHRRRPSYYDVTLIFVTSTKINIEVYIITWSDENKVHVTYCESNNVPSPETTVGEGERGREREGEGGRERGGEGEEEQEGRLGERCTFC